MALRVGFMTLTSLKITGVEGWPLSKTPPSPSPPRTGTWAWLWRGQRCSTCCHVIWEISVQIKWRTLRFSLISIWRRFRTILALQQRDKGRAGSRSIYSRWWNIFRKQEKDPKEKLLIEESNSLITKIPKQKRLERNPNAISAKWNLPNFYGAIICCPSIYIFLWYLN